jgi:hypothetical protein
LRIKVAHDKTEAIERKLQTTVGHNRGPPQQTHYLGSILLIKKTETNKEKKSSDNSLTQ